MPCKKHKDCPDCANYSLAAVEAAYRSAIGAVKRVKDGLGAGGRDAGMYTEIQIGQPICDAAQDAIEELISTGNALAEHDARLLEPMENLVKEGREYAVRMDCDHVKKFVGLLEAALRQARGTNGAKEG